MTTGAPPQAAIWHKSQILVIDRDDHLRFWARGVFQHQRVVAAMTTASFDEAKALLKRHSINLALIELGDDPAPTVALLTWLRNPKISPDPLLPVILLVKTLDKAALTQTLVFGIHAVLKKPLSGDALLRGSASALRYPSKILPRPEAPSPSRAPAAAVVAAPVPTTATPAPSVPPETPGPIPTRRPSQAVVAAAVAAPPVAVSAAPLPVAAAPAPIGKGPVETISLPPTTPRPAWDEPLVAPAVSAKPVRDYDLVEPTQPPPPKKPPVFVETRTAAKPASSAPGLDVDAILAAHAEWVQSAGGGGRRASLDGQDLAGHTMTGAVLTNAVLRSCDLSGCELTEAILHGADLRHAELVGCVMTGCDLSVARLRHARLRGSRLEAVNLRGADLAGADLSGTLLADANLAGANLLGADLSGADCSGATGMTQGMLDGAKGDMETRLPFGLLLAPPPDGG